MDQMTPTVIPGATRPPIHRSETHALCPEHADFVLAKILEDINGAQHTIDVGIYGFALKPLVDALIAAQQRGVKVRIVFDRTQSCGVGERDYVKTIADAGIEYYVGTSPRHQIRHSKDYVVDGQKGEMGSLNYSDSGLNQNNTVLFFEDIALSAFITEDLNDNIAWLIANEPQYNTPPGHPIITPTVT